ncbi:MAG: hypothetical protein QM778_19295 [Myxococcales bacterium]
MQKRPQHRTERRLKAAKWLAAPVAALGLMGCPNENLAPLAPCTVSGVSDDVPVTGVDKVDLLFMIDNSGSMAQEQAKLAEQLPNLLKILTSGKKEDGTTFTAVRDLHVGVVTSDMGLSGNKVPLPPSCEGVGDDGKLLKKPLTTGCSASAPAGYLSYVPGDKDIDSVIKDFTCLANVGIQGCGFEQQLEAVYKAVAPASVKFTDGKGGHADDANKGFLRSDAVLAVITVSDEEDCSVTEKGMVMFDDKTSAPGVKQPGTDMNLGLNIRCAYVQDPNDRTTQAEDNEYVYDVTRYYDDFKKKVKPLNPDRIVFAAITGIPEDAEGKSFDDILKDSRMDFAVDPMTGGGDPTNRNTAARDVCRRCETLSEAECKAAPLTVKDSSGKDISNPEIITGAKPGVRFVKVAKGFGDNGLVQSICAESFAPAVSTIIDKISKQLTGACLPRELNPNAEGLVECDVVEILGSNAGPEDCKSNRGRHYKEMRPVTVGDKTEMRVVCDINQVPVADQKLGTNPMPLEGTDGKTGWYYDTFSESVTKECPIEKRRRISFSSSDAEPQDATLRFECFQPVVSSNTEVLGKEAVNSPCKTNDDCAARQDHTPGNQFVLACDDTVKTCQITCNQDTECPDSWVCDTGRKLCVNPTCPPPSLR